MTTRALAVAGCLAGSLTVTADTVGKAEKDGDCKVATGPTGDFEAHGFCVEMLKPTDNELEKYDESDWAPADADADDADEYDDFAFIAKKDIYADPNKPDIGKFAFKKDGKIAFAFDVKVREHGHTTDPGDHCYSYSKDVTAEWDTDDVSHAGSAQKVKPTWLKPSLQAFKGLKDVTYEFAFLSPSRAGNDGGAFIFKWDTGVIKQFDLKEAEQEEDEEDEEEDP